MSKHDVFIDVYLFFYREFELNTGIITAEDETEELSATDVGL